MGTKAREFIAVLTERHDVIVIGGLAVITHGLQRPTKKADIWLDSMETPAESFAEILSRCSQNADGTWQPNPIDLAIGKDLTYLKKDGHDIRFLESKGRNRWIKLLPTATGTEAEALLERFVDWQTCKAALRNPNATVQEMTLGFLRVHSRRKGIRFPKHSLDERTIPPP
jgi:hypothetical protein